MNPRVVKMALDSFEFNIYLHAIREDLKSKWNKNVSEQLFFIEETGKIYNNLQILLILKMGWPILGVKESNKTIIVLILP